MMTTNNSEKDQKVETWYISGEYLSAAAGMVAWQLIDNEEAQFASMEEVLDRIEYIMRVHCPLARKYFLDHYPDERRLPPGANEIILDFVWQHRPMFMGGRPDGRATVTDTN